MRAAEVNFSETGAGDPMVLVMGLGADATAWAPHSNVWSREYRCIAVDNRGAGRTPLGPDPISTRSMAQDVIALMSELDIENSILVGISMGACIAQEVALAAPALVRKLVLVAPWARCDPFTASELSVLDRVYRLGDHRTFNELLRNTIWTPEWVNNHHLEMDRNLAIKSTMESAAFAQQVAACKSHDTIDRLSSITVPTLVTFGEDDRFIRPALSLETAALIGDAQVYTYQGSGHVHHWEQLDRFNRDVSSWLSR